MTKIIYIKDGQEIEVDADPHFPISKNAKIHGINFASAPTCQGQGQCGLCQMRVLAKDLPAKDADEIRLCGEEDETLRLGCRIKPREGMRVEIL